MHPPPSNQSLVTASDRAQDINVEEHFTVEEFEILKKCCHRCCVDDGVVIPRMLTTFASSLKDKGNIQDWEQCVDYADDVMRQEYDALDDTSKLIFLDLTIFAREMRYTHMDFHAELEWEEHDNSRLLTTEFLAIWHGIPFDNVEKKVGCILIQIQ